MPGVLRELNSRVYRSVALGELQKICSIVLFVLNRPLRT